MDGAGLGCLLHGHPMSMSRLLLYCGVVLHHEAGAAGLTVLIGAAGMVGTAPRAAATPMELGREGYAESVIQVQVFHQLRSPDPAIC